MHLRGSAGITIALIMAKRFSWTPESIALLGTDADVAIARRLRISPALVQTQRQKRGILSRHERCKWGETELALLRTHTDAEVAHTTGRTLEAVAAKRRSIGNVGAQKSQ